MRKYETLFAPDQPSIVEAPEAVLSTLTRDGKRRWIYPKPSRGRYYRARFIVAWALIALYLVLPLIPIRGRPAVLLDLMSREFTLFGTTFYPTDTLLLMLLIVGTLVSIVLVSALLGRAWCGWACPQTVYLEFVFRPIERWIEGSERQRARRDFEPLSLDRAWRKTLKWSAYAVVSLLLAHSLVAYFVGWGSLLDWMTRPPSEHWGYFLMMSVTTGLVLFDFAVFREQMCTITCPYARFQSVLLDKDSLIVSYDPRRGEPRGKMRDRAVQTGDCVDCLACVRTCPVGIDIRDGLQMECVACTQCIDACDEIMDRIQRPRGLIRFTSQNALNVGRSRILRPRTALYGVLMLVLAGLFTGTLASRSEFEAWVVRQPGDPFMVLPDGRIANRLRFRVQNQTRTPASFTIEVVAPSGAEVRIVGVQPIAVAANELALADAWVTVPQLAFDQGTAAGVFAIRFDERDVRHVDFSLIGPSR